MHVGLNLVYLVPGETGGMETYARELIPALMRETSDVRLTAFLSREAAADGLGPWCEAVPSIVVPVLARRRWQWVLGEQQLLPRLAQQAGVDLVHSLASTAPARGSFRRVVTIHDIVYRLYPRAHQRVRAQAMRLLVPLAARRSHRIIAPSHATRDDLVRLVGAPAERIDVVLNGLGASAAGPPPRAADLRRRLGLDTRPFVLTVSAKRPHKNLRRLLEALALIPAERRPVLVLPGYPTAHENDLRIAAVRLGLTADTRFLGWVPGEELEGLYREATCAVFPSLYEGFGLPVLEAMARGVPVACSARGALGEIAGEAALRFDPESTSSISAAIERLLGDAAERQRLRALGTVQAARYSWRETARGTLASYERALSPV